MSGLARKARLALIGGLARQERASSGPPGLAPRTGGHCVEPPGASEGSCGQLLEHAKPWDSIVLDEAHDPGRWGAGSAQEKWPNVLLRLMQQLKDWTKGLVLLTATPMRVHAAEARDLLDSPGLPDEWIAHRRVPPCAYDRLGPIQASHPVIDWLRSSYFGAIWFVPSTSIRDRIDAFSTESEAWPLIEDLKAFRWARAARINIIWEKVALDQSGDCVIG